MWFGFGLSSKVTVAAMVAFFPVLVNVIVGLRTVEQEKPALMRSMGARQRQLLRFVLFPNALPFIFTGLNIALVFSITGAIVGEFVGSRSGIGNLILQLNFNLEAAGVFAARVCLALMGLGLHVLIQWIPRKVVFLARAGKPDRDLRGVEITAGRVHGPWVRRPVLERLGHGVIIRALDRPPAGGCYNRFFSRHEEDVP